MRRCDQPSTPPASQSAHVDNDNQPLTTNQGVKIADNQHSLKIGLRGPTALFGRPWLF